MEYGHELIKTPYFLHTVMAQATGAGARGGGLREGIHMDAGMPAIPMKKMSGAYTSSIPMYYIGAPKTV